MSTVESSARNSLPGADQLFDLSPVVRARHDDLFRAKVAGVFGGSVALFGAVTLSYFLATGGVIPSLVDGDIIGTAILFAFGIFFVGATIHRVLNPYYSALRVTAEAVTFVSPRSAKSVRLGWHDPEFHLRLFKDEWNGEVGQCCETTDGWAPHGLTEEGFNAVIQAAREKGLTIKEKKSWFGLRTHVDIGPWRDSQRPSGEGL